MTARLLGFASALALAACSSLEEDPECVESECTTPPVAFCDGGVLYEYASTGTCVGDDCRYEVTTTPCPAGCAVAEGSAEGSAEPACAPGS